MKKNNLPEGLAEKQRQVREETKQKVRESIEMLREIGYEDITISLLVKETGLSRSTFSKPHIQDILKKYKVGKYKENKVLVQAIQNASERQKREELERQLINANKKIEKLETSLKNKTDELNKMKVEVAEKKQQLEITVGNFQALYDKLISLGIDIKL